MAATGSTRRSSRRGQPVGRWLYQHVPVQDLIGRPPRPLCQTDRYRRSAARRQLYGYYRNPHSDDPEVSDPQHPGRRTSANTTPVILAGRLYATKEEGLPYEIDPNTLETRGETDFNGAWHSQTFTAHPKFDPATGETFAFGYEATGLASRDVFACSFDRAGRITWEVRFEVPYASMLHDMALTRPSDHPGSGTMTGVERPKAAVRGRRTRPSFPVHSSRGGPDISWFEGGGARSSHRQRVRDRDKLVMEARCRGHTWPWLRMSTGRRSR